VRRILIVTPHPNDIDAALDQATARVDIPRTFSFHFDLHETWIGPDRRTRLTAVFLIDRESVQGFVTDRPLDSPEPEHFDATANRCRAAIFRLEQPLRLAPVAIAKPWGFEHWYSGIEARGVSNVTDGRHTTPLSWVLGAAPRHLCGDAPIALLKVLDPAPNPVLGDLYFELHETKDEFYVVTRVDRRAWPDGHGAIRFGMNAALRASYRDDKRFRADYAAAVARYEETRRAIDRLLDEKRSAAGFDLDAVVPVDLMQRWIDDVEVSLVEEERRRRRAMDAFTQMRSLSEGDIVQLPRLLPHALQHGVRVIELQTPTYERRIVSFAQKVLTQSHWDTAAAIDAMRLDSPAPTPPRALIREPDCTVERIVEFDGFAARRITLAPGARLTIARDLRYAICVGVAGETALGDATLASEDACLVASSATQRTLVNAGTRRCVCVLCGPEL
jgi:hypothetical protein